MSEEHPIVTIEDGKLKGAVKIDWLGGKYYGFQGIPYAKAPLGKLRFKAPQPVDPWDGIKDATKDGDCCYHYDIMTRKYIGSEDCLFLNVFTPELPSNKKELKPVMVWIHGGGFAYGSGSTELHGPDFLVAEGVIIVTFNYRLGFLGFASFSDQSLDIPGNAGLKDQVMALKWVQKNISKFGGDPSNVTIFGVSAGGASVYYLMVSPLTKGLFNKAISQSGACTSGWATGQPSAPLVAKVLGIHEANQVEIIKILNDLPVEKIMEIQEKLPLHMFTSIRSYGPVVESTNDKSAFLSRKPEDILSSGDYCHVPLVVGFTSREGRIVEFFKKMVNEKVKWYLDDENVMPLSLKNPKDSKIAKNVLERIKQFYYGNENVSAENIDQYYLHFGDKNFFIDINNFVRIQTKTSSCPVYYYRMSVNTRLNWIKKMTSINYQGAAHGDDILYLFKNVITPKIIPKSPEHISLRRFVKLWTTFAKHGNPNPATFHDIVNITWPPTENSKLHFLDIGDNLTVGVNPESDRVAFWDEIFELCNTK